MKWRKANCISLIGFEISCSAETASNVSHRGTSQVCNLRLWAPLLYCDSHWHTLRNARILVFCSSTMCDDRFRSVESGISAQCCRHKHPNIQFMKNRLKHVFALLSRTSRTQCTMESIPWSTVWPQTHYKQFWCFITHHVMSLSSFWFGISKVQKLVENYPIVSGAPLG